MAEPTMCTLDNTAWEVLNATADDYENLEQIYHQICFNLVDDGEMQGHLISKLQSVANAPSLTEVADHVRGLVEQGLLAIVMDENGYKWDKADDLSYVWRGWFSMTSKGKSIWESSPQFGEQEQPDEHSR